MCCRSIWSVEAPEMSFLYFIWYIANQRRVSTTSARPRPSPIRRRASASSTAPSSSRTCSRRNSASSASTSRRSASSRTRNGGNGDHGRRQRLHRAAAPIVAMSPAMSAVPMYDPPLPDGPHPSSPSRAAMGRTMKCFFTYSTTFWRPAYSGLCNCNLPPLAWGHGPSRRTTAPRPLMCFVVGAQGRPAGADDRRPACRRRSPPAFKLIFADDRALAPHIAPHPGLGPRSSGRAAVR